MADVGKKTGKQTQAGRDVYETPEGEMVSEKSTTFEYKGKWINIPTIHGGKQYSEDQLIKLLDEGLIEPTSTHDELEEAIEAAQSRSDSLEFNKGGTPMEEQMELFEDGGLKDEGGMVDEESGNDVPTGSTKKEVRDDIPAMLSEGEFVLPADVVRYHGLEKIMQLRDEAKFGLKKMEAMGQMGNSEEATLDDDVPFGPADLIIVGAEPIEDEPREMAQGGMVHAQAGTYVPPATGIMGYQPSIYQGQQTTSTYTPPPSSVAPPTPAPSPAGGYVPKFVTNQTTPFDDGSLAPKTTTTQTAANTSSGVSTASTENKFFDTVEDVYTTKEYINPETGERRTISFYQGNPVTDIPEGFIPLEDYESQSDDLESTSVQTTQVTPLTNRDDNNAGRQRIADLVSKKQQESRVAIKDMKDDVLLDAYKQNQQSKAVLTALSAINPFVGMVGRAAASLHGNQLEKEIEKRELTLPDQESEKQNFLQKLGSGLSGAFSNLKESFSQEYEPDYTLPNISSREGFLGASEAAAYDNAVKSGNVSIVNHYTAINRLRQKQNDFIDQDMTDAEGRAMGLSEWDIEQAKKFGGSVQRAQDKEAADNNTDTESDSNKPSNSGTSIGEKISNAVSNFFSGIFGGDDD